MAKENTQEQFAKLVDITQPTVAQLIHKGILTRGAGLSTWLKEYTKNLREQAAGWASKDGRVDRMAEAGLLDIAKRKLLELQYDKEIGGLIPLPAFKAALEFFLATARAKFLGAPSRIRSQDPHVTARQVAVWEQQIREILEELTNVQFPDEINRIAQHYLVDLHAAHEANDKRVGGSLPDTKPGKQRRAG